MKMVNDQRVRKDMRQECNLFELVLPNALNQSKPSIREPNSELITAHAMVSFQFRKFRVLTRSLF